MSDLDSVGSGWNTNVAFMNAALKFQVP